jgi:hypothetical protein
MAPPLLFLVDYAGYTHVAAMLLVYLDRIEYQSPDLNKARWLVARLARLARLFII